MKWNFDIALPDLVLCRFYEVCGACPVRGYDINVPETVVQHIRDKQTSPKMDVAQKAVAPKTWQDPSVTFDNGRSLCNFSDFVIRKPQAPVRVTSTLAPLGGVKILHQSVFDGIKVRWSCLRQIREPRLSRTYLPKRVPVCL